MSNKIIDLYSGCGGFSLGADMAGFETSVAIDIDSDLLSGFARNFPETRAIRADVSKLNEKFWDDLGLQDRPAGVIGGPPCQGFSRMGKREKRDPRNALIGAFFDQVDILRPKFFVLENVEGLLDAGCRKVLDRELGRVKSDYAVLQPMLIDSAAYGAATKRRRVIVVGYDPKEVNCIAEDDFKAPARKRKATVSDAIRDLPSPRASVTIDNGFSWASYPESREISRYAKKMRKLPTKKIGWKIAKDALSNGRVTGVQGTAHNSSVIRRFDETQPGTVESISRYPRLSWGGLCPTLRAGTGKDRGSYQSMRPIHPEEPRVITVREAARLQGFPDWFVFHPTKWHSFRMIGNSVSPIMSHAVLSVIASKLELKLAA